MDALKEIQAKQQEWAKDKRYDLVGGTLLGGEPKGEKNYVKTIDENLYRPLSTQSRKDFEAGNGHETQDECRLAKMKALHSSSALVVNFFQYWRDQADKSPLLEALALPKELTVMEFEKRLIISDKYKNKFRMPAHLDVMLSDGVKYVGIESKMTEPYNPSKKPSSFTDTYFLKEYESSLWKDLSTLRELAQGISTKGKRFKYLDAAQLIKHILGLRNSYGSEFELMYLWYDVESAEGKKHCEEANEFMEITKRDKVRFRHITYQEVFSRLKSNCGNSHKEYSDYLTERYF